MSLPNQPLPRLEENRGNYTEFDLEPIRSNVENKENETLRWLWGKQGNTEKGCYLAETNTYHENIPNSKTACVRTERQQVGTK